MRMHATLEDVLVIESDRRAGAGRCGAFVVEPIARGRDDERRWDEIESALGGLPDTGHDWDDDPAAWVRLQRRADAHRSG